MTTDFLNPSYLRTGNERQQQVYQALSELRIFNVLSGYNPTLTGTIPIGIDLPSSDLDIICECHDVPSFQSQILNNYGHEEDFHYRTTVKQELPTQIANFHFQGFEVEIFTQPLPVKDQMAFRHMIKEHEILQSKDKEFKIEIIALKKKGISTEAAFTKLLGIKGDPYLELLKYKT